MTQAEFVEKWMFGRIQYTTTFHDMTADLTALLATVREEERERCAMIADAMVAPIRATSTREHTASHTTAYKIATAIRQARGR